MAVESGRIAILPTVLGIIRTGAAVPCLMRAAFVEGVSLLNIWACWSPLLPQRA